MNLVSFLSGLFVWLLFVTSANAQGIVITTPKPDSYISRDQQLTVRIDKPNSLTSSEDVSIVIALRSCASFPQGSCASYDPTGVLGWILAKAPYEPGPDYQGGPWYQSFTIHIPWTFPVGQASLSVTHFELLGAGPIPLLDTRNVIVHIV